MNDLEAAPGTRAREVSRLCCHLWFAVGVPSMRAAAERVVCEEVSQPGAATPSAPVNEETARSGRCGASRARQEATTIDQESECRNEQTSS